MPLKRKGAKPSEGAGARFHHGTPGRAGGLRISHERSVFHALQAHQRPSDKIMSSTLGFEDPA